jgi:general secretion pathway protein M
MFARVNQWWLDRLPPAWLQAWRNLSERDRKSIQWLGAVVGLAFIYFLVWSPVSGGLDKAQNRLDRAQSEWQWLNAQVPKLENQPATPATVLLDSQSRLTAYVQQKLRAHQIFSQLSEIAPINKRNRAGIEVRFDSVKAPHFFAWLSEMEQEGVLVKTLEVKPLKPGLIQAKAEFEVAS